MNNKISCEVWGAYLFRIALGVVFLAHGIQKFANIDMTAQFFAGLGLTAAMGYIIALVETLAGLSMLLGLFVRYAAYAIVAVMLVAIVLVKRKMGFFGGWELDLTLLLVAAGVACMPKSTVTCPGCCLGFCKGHDKK